MKAGYYILIVIAFACNRPAEKKVVPVHAEHSLIIPDKIISYTDTALELRNGVWYYRQQPFSGYIEKKFPTGRRQWLQSFYRGADEGWFLSFYPDGHPDAKRYYHSGEKDSTHIGWWENGNLRYAYHFRSGRYEGDFKEWYQSGKPLKHLVYRDGKEVKGTGWRENGKVYMSFEVRDGRLYGLVNPNLCYSLKNEKGEFVKSVR